MQDLRIIVKNGFTFFLILIRNQSIQGFYVFISENVLVKFSISGIFISSL